MLYKALNQHQADKGLTQANTVAEERAAVLGGDLHQGVVALFLVVVQNGIHFRLGLLPFRYRHFVAAEELLKRPCIDLKRHVLTNMAFKNFQDVRSYVFRFLPVLFVPLLDHTHRLTGDLDVEFDVFGQAGNRKV